MKTVPYLSRMNNEFLYTIKDQETNMMAYVIKSTTGKFHACLKDLDSGEVVPYIKIASDLETATTFANEML